MKLLSAIILSIFGRKDKHNHFFNQTSVIQMFLCEMDGLSGLGHGLIEGEFFPWQLRVLAMVQYCGGVT